MSNFVANKQEIMQIDSFSYFKYNLGTSVSSSWTVPEESAVNFDCQFHTCPLAKRNSLRNCAASLQTQLCPLCNWCLFYQLAQILVGGKEQKMFTLDGLLKVAISSHHKLFSRFIPSQCMRWQGLISFQINHYSFKDRLKENPFSKLSATIQRILHGFSIGNCLLQNALRKLGTHNLKANWFSFRNKCLFSRRCSRLVFAARFSWNPHVILYNTVIKK